MNNTFAKTNTRQITNNEVARFVARYPNHEVPNLILSDFGIEYFAYDRGEFCETAVSGMSIECLTQAKVDARQAMYENRRIYKNSVVHKSVYEFYEMAEA